MLGDDIEMIILGIDGDYVKLGFNAPQSVQILRKELHQGIAAENAAAETIKPNKQQIDNVLKNFKK